jgi:cell division septal protein FtsQ
MKDIPTSPRIKQIRRKRRMSVLRHFILFFMLFLSIIWALSYFSNAENMVINKIIVTGTHILDQERIEREVKKDLSGKYIYLFSKENGFIYPQKQIYKNLILNFPRIETLSISHEGLKTLKIEITERIGSYLYCGASIPENKNEIGENCYYINNDGYIFDKAPYFSGNVYFKYYLTLKDGDANPLSRQMIDIERFHLLGRFIDGITSLGFKPIYIVVGKDGINSLYMDHGVNDTLPKILFKNDADLENILENLSLAMKKSEFASEINSKYNKLLYIDLRFKNKVLYKFQ